MGSSASSSRHAGNRQVLRLERLEEREVPSSGLHVTPMIGTIPVGTGNGLPPAPLGTASVHGVTPAIGVIPVVPPPAPSPGW